jgi:hypothetical protein
MQVGNGGSWGELWEFVRKKKIPITNPTLEFAFKTNDLRGEIKAHAWRDL